ELRKQPGADDPRRVVIRVTQDPKATCAPANRRGQPALPVGDPDVPQEEPCLRRRIICDELSGGGERVDGRRGGTAVHYCLPERLPAFRQLSAARLRLVSCVNRAAIEARCVGLSKLCN